MRVEIDQSGKIETTSQHTVIGLSDRNGTVTKTVLLSAREKKKIQRTFRDAGKPATFVYRTFAAAIVLLIHEIKEPTTIVIDTEYSGHEEHILQSILDLSVKLNLTFERRQIQFQAIGKKSPAHRVAIQAYRRKRADKHLSARTVLALLLQ